MDSKRFDALTRGIGAQRNRRDAVKAFAAGFVGLGVVKGVSAQVSIEEATCGQSCVVSGDCNAGLECSRPSGDNGICVRIPDTGFDCDENADCDQNYEVCRNGECVNQVVCDRCNIDANCPGDEVCRNGRCGDEGCRSDGDCPRRRVCRNGRCIREDECNSNRDCPRRRVCRGGRCVRRN